MQPLDRFTARGGRALGLALVHPQTRELVKAPARFRFTGRQQPRGPISGES